MKGLVSTIAIRPHFSLDLRSQVIPALIASRKFIFDVAIEKGGRAKTVNVPIDFGTYTL